MTPEQVTIVQNSFHEMAPRATYLVKTFYDELFERAPHLRDKFPQDMAEQRTKLLQTLTYAVNGLKFPSVIVPVVENLGALHRAHMVDAFQYAIVGDALIYAIAKTRGDALTWEEREAWETCYELLSTVMQNGAKRH